MFGSRTAAVLHLLAVPLLGLALVLGALVAPAEAATGPSLTLTGPATAARGSQVTLRATLTSTAGTPMGSQTIGLQAGGTTVATGQTGTDGTVDLTVTLSGTTTFVAARDAVGDGTGDDAAVTSPERTVRAFAATTSLVLTGPSSGYVDSPVTLKAKLTRDDSGAGVVGEQVMLQRRVGAAWQDVRPAPTDAAGVASYSVEVQPTDNTFRAVYAGRYDRGDGTDNLRASTSTAAGVTPRKRATELRLTGPDRIVDETSVALRLTWRAGNGDPVPGRVVVYRSLAGGDWTRYDTVSLGADGSATFRVSPRVDSRWKASGPAGRWWLADTSPVKGLDNVPPGTPVSYPKAAPRPAIALPKNARATGAGANATISGISDAVWRSMVGRTWHSGCPVGRSQLRLVRVNYWGYDGYRYRGEIVLRDSVAARGAAMFTSMYRQKLPIWRMYRVDRFGWSSTLHGGNDYKSMRAGNTSGFNCRGVVGNPSVPSPHSYGRSIDLNTWENPYRSKQGLVPNSWWQYHSHPRIAWRSRSHPVVQTMAAQGFRWTYGLGDTQHFDG